MPPTWITRIKRWALAVAILVTVLQSVTLVQRGERRLSDIGVYHRASEMLRHGAGADIYRGTQPGWPISMPPVGFAVFKPFASLGNLGGSLAWAAVNLALLAVIAGAVWRTVHGRAPDLERVFPWVITVLLLLSAGSLQVGQFSILFVACWALALLAAAKGKPATSAIWLALPAAVKLYPAVLAAAPVASARNRQAAAKTALVFVGAALSVWLFVPFAAYGAEAPAMNLSWLQNVILNGAQMEYLCSLRAVSNQGMDTILLRYLTHDPSFHDAHFLPHLHLPKAFVLALAHAARILVVAVTSWFVWRRHRAEAARNRLTTESVLAVFAAWVSAMYLIMPETKSRYAVYTFLAFLPWLNDAARAATFRAQWQHAAGMALTIALVAGALPQTLQVWGAGFTGALALWLRALGSLRHLSLGAGCGDTAAHGAAEPSTSDTSLR